MRLWRPKEVDAAENLVREPLFQGREEALRRLKTSYCRAWAQTALGPVAKTAEELRECEPPPRILGMGLLDVL